MIYLAETFDLMIDTNSRLVTIGKAARETNP